jgi:hypothetical protein
MPPPAIRVVIDDLVMRRANEGDMMHLPREHGQMLAHLHTGDRGRDRLELAAHFRGRGGLHVPQVLMRWPALQEEQDARFGCAAAHWSSPRGLGPKQPRQRQAAQRQAAHAKQLTPG